MPSGGWRLRRMHAHTHATCCATVSGRVGLVKACRGSAKGFYWPFGPETARLWVRFWAAWGRHAAASPRFHGFGSGASLWRLPRFAPSVLRGARARRGWFTVFLPAARRLKRLKDAPKWSCLGAENGAWASSIDGVGSRLGVSPLNSAVPCSAEGAKGALALAGAAACRRERSTPLARARFPPQIPLVRFLTFSVFS